MKNLTKGQELILNSWSDKCAIDWMIMENEKSFSDSVLGVTFDKFESDVKTCEGFRNISKIYNELVKYRLAYEDECTHVEIKKERKIEVKTYYFYDEARLEESYMKFNNKKLNQLKRFIKPDIDMIIFCDKCIWMRNENKGLEGFLMAMR